MTDVAVREATRLEAVEAGILEALDAAYATALSIFNSGAEGPEGGDTTWGLSSKIRDAIASISARGASTSAVFTNIITSLAIKAHRPDIDIRYHQVQIQDRTEHPAGFNFRGPSETTVYPWLDSRGFDGAKSGWQTRTLERPKPYTLDYEENIRLVKAEFLSIYDAIQEDGEEASFALAFAVYLEIKKRELKSIPMAVPRTDDIATIVNILKSHFFGKYSGVKGASRLPVLALYAIYEEMLLQLKRFDGKRLRPLQEHSAADAQTGAIGDIEVEDNDGEVFEAVEVKHNQIIDQSVVVDVKNKLMESAVQRYYILTTHANCQVSEAVQSEIDGVERFYKTQIIANGALNSIRYYLRLLEDPSAVFPRYVQLLKLDKALGREHRDAWNNIANNPTLV